MNAQTQSRPLPFRAAVIAGIVGGVILDLKLIIVDHAQVPQMWQFIASTLVGQVAFTSVSYAALGLVMHFVTAIFWALLYLIVWNRLSSLHNWILGGLAWGIVVMLGMLTFLHFKVGMEWPGITDASTRSSLIGHTIFYGLPVAWVIARAVRAR